MAFAIYGKCHILYNTKRSCQAGKHEILPGPSRQHFPNLIAPLAQSIGLANPVARIKVTMAGGLGTIPRSVDLPVGLWLTILACNATIAPEQVLLIVVSLSAPFGSRRSWPSNATA